jgi:hypothetical protein
MFGNQTLLCQVVLPVRSCAAAIRPDRERALRARPAGRLAKLLGLTVTSVQFDKLPHGRLSGGSRHTSRQKPGAATDFKYGLASSRLGGMKRCCPHLRNSLRSGHPIGGPE